MQPIVHGLEQEYGDRISFVYLNVDDPNTAEMKRRLGYRIQPHFFLLNADGEIVGEWLGAVREEQFRNAFEALLNDG